MPKLYASFEELVKSHDALFRPHRQTGALNVCRGVWEAREPEVQSLKEQLIALKAEYDRLSFLHSEVKTNLTENATVYSRHIQEIENQNINLKKDLDTTKSSLNEFQTKAENSQRNLIRLQKYEDSLDAVQRSQYSEIETQKKRFSAESGLRAELELALAQMNKASELNQLEIISKDDLIARLQARIEDLESRGKQQQRLNARMGLELDRFARENDQLARAINQ